MGKIFYIMGKSASGKDHIYARLAAHEELGLKKLVLYTTPSESGRRKKTANSIILWNDKKLKEFQEKAV